MKKVLDRTSLSKESFRIHDHLDKLQPTKTKGKYICPVCGKNDLSIAKNGAYKCWHGCESKDIREALAPWQDKQKSDKGNYSTPINPKNIKRKAQRPEPCVIPSTAIQLALMAKIPGDIPQLINESIPKFLTEKLGIPDIAKVKTYQYSENQMIKRYQWDDESKPKGYDKTIRPWHLENGKLKMGKGDEEWLPYRIEEAVANGTDRWVLGVEGENGVEDGRALGIPTITWQGGSWGETDLEAGLTVLKNGNVKGLIFISDNDETGEKKAQALLEISGKVDFPVLVIPASKLWDECPEKGDISDWIQWGKTQGMNDKEFIRKLEEEIHKAVAEREKQQASKAYEDLPPHERLKLDIKAYLATPDIFNKVIMRSHICSSYRIKIKEFELLCDTIEQQNRIDKNSILNGEEFWKLETQGLNWLIPGLLPKGETILLAAQAKVGKTLLAMDIAYSVLSGDPTLGELPGVKGKVLLISSDESARTTSRRLKARGFDLLPEANKNLRIMTKLSLNRLGELEEELEKSRPQLVIIDSLTSITLDMDISENSAEYAKGIYRLTELIHRYGSSGIIIHHENKNKEAKGLAKVAGSSRIIASTWGIAQLVSTNPDNDQCIQRWLKIKPREGEAVTLSLEINPKDTWATNGIFNFLGEFGDESGEKRTHGERVLELLKKFSPKGLEFKEIDNYLNIGRGLYTILDRLEDRQLITKRRSSVNKRSWVYALPGDTTTEDHTTSEEMQNIGNTPPPNLSSPPNVEESETMNIQELEPIQQQFNPKLIEDQQTENPKNDLKSENSDEIEVIEDKSSIQQHRDSKEERVYNKDAEKENVTQNRNNKFKVGDLIKGEVVHPMGMMTVKGKVTEFHKKNGSACLQLTDKDENDYPLSCVENIKAISWEEYHI